MTEQHSSLIQAEQGNNWVNSAPLRWQIARHQLAHRDALFATLNEYAADFPEGHYWVLLQGRMNAKSQRQSLLNLDSVTALVAVLDAYFQHNEEDYATVMLLPGWQATGILFTRHPLRRDLSHWLVEGVTSEKSATQRLIFTQQGRLVFAADNDQPLLDVVPEAAFIELASNTQQTHSAPQAIEWVFDGTTLWVLQTLTIGSLPKPKEAWTCRANDGFWYQAVTPLWYTLEGRWLKNRYWEPLVARNKWRDLVKVEPYKRQYSHIYRNVQFLRQLPQCADDMPPGWQPTPQKETSMVRAGWQQLQRASRLRKFKKRLIKTEQEEGVWQRFKQLDLLGEELAEIIGPLHYAAWHDSPARYVPDSVKQWFVNGDLGLLSAGVDPVHRLLADNPPERTSLPTEINELAPSTFERLFPAPSRLLDKQLGEATLLRETLSARIQSTLKELSNPLVSNGVFKQPDDVYFCYYDELWLLCEKQQVPPSLSFEKLNQRKVRYLEDAHRGAPDWQLDGLGFGFSQDNQPHQLLLGNTAVAGQVEGCIRRLVSGWALNQIKPGDILVMHRCDPHWLPWLTQAAAIVVAANDNQDHAVRLAQAFNIPCLYGLQDAVHCLTDGQQVSLDAECGRITAV